MGELGYRSAGYSAPIKAHGPGPNPRFYFKADPVNGYKYVVLLKQHSVQGLDTRRILEIGRGTGYWLPEFVNEAQPQNIKGVEILFVRALAKCEKMTTDA